MESNNEMLSFRVLGQEISFKSQQDEDEISAHDVVELVNNEAEKVSQVLPHLEQSQIAVLVALNLAQDKLRSEIKARNELSKIRSSAVDALRFIEEVSPSLN